MVPRLMPLPNHSSLDLHEHWVIDEFSDDHLHADLVYPVKQSLEGAREILILTARVYNPYLQLAVHKRAS